MTPTPRNDDDDVAAAEGPRASPAAISTDLVVGDDQALDPVRAAAVVDAWRTTRTRGALFVLPIGALSATVVLVAGGYVPVPVAVAELLVPAALGASAACLAAVAAVREARFRRRCAELGLTAVARTRAREHLASANERDDDELLVRKLTGAAVVGGRDGRITGS